MNESLFPEYQEITPLLQIGSYMIGKYKKKEKEPQDKDCRIMETKHPVIYGGSLPQGLPYTKKKRGITNERQAILKEIQDIIEQENGGKINTKVFAMKLSHVPTEDLYWMKSQGLDYRNRSKKPFSKFIYGSIKPKKLSTV